MTLDICQRLTDANVRIEAMWPFPVQHAPEELAKVFEYADELQDFPPPLRVLIQSLPEFARDDLYDGDSGGFQDAFDELCANAFRAGVHGWIGVAANPVFKPTGTGGASFSWGYYNTVVMFAETADQLLVDAAEWGEERFLTAAAQAEGGAA